MSERINRPVEPTDELVSALSRLQPRSSGGIARDRLLFLAGRREALREGTGRRRWGWPLATAASWLMTAGILTMWMMWIQWPIRQDGRVVANGDAKEQLSGPAAESVANADPSQTGSRTAEPSPPVRRSNGDSTNNEPTHADLAVSGALAQSRSEIEVPKRERSRFGNHSGIDAVIDLDELPRLSMVGWESWQQSRSRPAMTGAAFDKAESSAPPATYLRLMKLYLDDHAAADERGEIL